jgi:hypothetical protein
MRNAAVLALVVAGCAKPADSAPVDSDDHDSEVPVDTDLPDQPPPAPVVGIHPSDPDTLDELVAVMLTPSVDPDGDAVDYTVAWTVDGVDAGIDGPTVPADATTRGQVWSAVMTPNDGQVDGPAGEASVTIGNAAPSTPTVVIAPDPAFTDDRLVATIVTPSVDPDGDEVTCVWRWTRDGVYSVFTADQVPASVTVHFDPWEVQLTPNDPFEAGDAGAASITVSNSPPSAAGATDADDDPLAYAYAWQLDGAAFPNAIGPGGDTVAGADVVAGHTWTCEAVADDGFQAGPAASISAVAI